MQKIETPPEKNIALKTLVTIPYQKPYPSVTTSVTPFVTKPATTVTPKLPAQLKSLTLTTLTAFKSETTKVTKTPFFNSKTQLPLQLATAKQLTRTSKRLIPTTKRTTAKSTTKRTTAKSTTKRTTVKSTTKRNTAKPTTKRITAKPTIKVTTAKPTAKLTTAKPTSKSTSRTTKYITAKPTSRTIKPIAAIHTTTTIKRFLTRTTTETTTLAKVTTTKNVVATTTKVTTATLTTTQATTITTTTTTLTTILTTTQATTTLTTTTTLAATSSGYLSKLLQPTKLIEGSVVSLNKQVTIPIVTSSITSSTYPSVYSSSKPLLRIFDSTTKAQNNGNQNADNNIKVIILIVFFLFTRFI